MALVLSGGMSLGAYQAGAYAVFQEASGLRPQWLAGTSIGAVNAAIIAGNPPERRVAQLRSFWEAAAAPSLGSPLAYGCLPMPGPWRHVSNWMSALQTRLFGRPGLFQPRLPIAFSALASDGAENLGAYDLSPLRDRLEEVIDFERLNGGECRLSVVAVDVATGEEVVFDTYHGDRIEPAHLLATCGFLPDFPPTEIDGRLLGDGGLSANTPLDVVFGDTAAGADLLCFVLDLFARNSDRPRSFEAAMARGRDLLFANQSWKALEAYRREHRLSAIIAGLAARLPPELRDEAELEWLPPIQDRAVTVLHLSYHAPAVEVAEKPFDYSGITLAERWRTGTLDMRAALRALEAVRAGKRSPGLAVHEIRR